MRSCIGTVNEYIVLRSLYRRNRLHGGYHSEVFEDEDGIMIYADFASFGQLQKALEDMNKEIISSGFEQIPNVTKKLTDPDEIAAINKLLEKIEEDDDVQNVFHSMKE